MGSPNREAVKVVLIETQYVEADTATFKSVVQSLTGKDATVNDGSGKRKRDATTATPSKALDVKTRDDIACDDVVSWSGHCRSYPSMSFLTKGMSFKDLDTTLLEIPSLEEICWLYDL